MDNVLIVSYVLLYIFGAILTVPSMLLFNKYMKATVCPNNSMTWLEIIFASFLSWFAVGSIIMASLFVTVAFIYETVKGKANDSKLAEFLTKEI